MYTSEVASCLYVRGLSSDVNKAYALIFLDYGGAYGGNVMVS